MNKIPESFEFNLEGLEIGDSIHISHTKIDEGVEPQLKIETLLLPVYLLHQHLYQLKPQKIKLKKEEEGKDKEAAEESKPEEENKK